MGVGGRGEERSIPLYYHYHIAMGRSVSHYNVFITWGAGKVSVYAVIMFSLLGVLAKSQFMAL